MTLETQLEIYRIQTPDVIRVFDTGTKTFSRHFDAFHSCVQYIIYDNTSGQIKGVGSYKIINIPLNPDSAREEIKSIVTQIRNLMVQLHPLVVEATLLECAYLEQKNDDSVTL